MTGVQFTVSHLYKINAKITILSTKHKINNINISTQQPAAHSFTTVKTPQYTFFPAG